MAFFGVAVFLLLALLLVQPCPSPDAQKRPFVMYLDHHAHGSQLHNLAAVDLTVLEEKAAYSHYQHAVTKMPPFSWDYRSYTWQIKEEILVRGPHAFVYLNFLR
jgi:hypothetical protein